MLQVSLSISFFYLPASQLPYIESNHWSFQGILPALQRSFTSSSTWRPLVTESIWRSFCKLSSVTVLWSLSSYTPVLLNRGPNRGFVAWYFVITTPPPHKERLKYLEHFSSENKNSIEDVMVVVGLSSNGREWKLGNNSLTIRCGLTKLQPFVLQSLWNSLPQDVGVSTCC